MPGLGPPEPHGLIGKARLLLDRIEPRPAPDWSRTAIFWANPRWSLACFLFLLGALVVHPPQGLPIRLCLFHALFGVDCPGCGMTRGLTNLWRGNVLSALEYNLFAPIAFVYLLLQSSFLFLPVSFRRQTVDLLNRCDTWIRKAAVIGIVLFFLIGFLRASLQLLALRA